jgi:hypothetical protein
MNATKAIFFASIVIVSFMRSPSFFAINSEKINNNKQVKQQEKV